MDANKQSKYTKIALVLIVIFIAFRLNQNLSFTPEEDPVAHAVAHAFSEKTSGVHLTDDGVIVGKLPDEVTTDARYQRFIVNVGNGQTLLIRHNITTAQKIDAVGGMNIRFCGIYDYDEKGGILSNTNQNPTDESRSGWVEVSGVRYQ